MQLLSAAPVGLSFSWRYSERLVDPWPKDPFPMAPFVFASGALLFAVLLQLVVVVVFRRQIFR